MSSEEKKEIKCQQCESEMIEDKIKQGSSLVTIVATIIVLIGVYYLILVNLVIGLGLMAIGGIWNHIAGGKKAKAIWKCSKCGYMFENQLKNERNSFKLG